MPIAFGEFVFDHGRRELSRGGAALKVDAKLLDLLACFLAHPGRLLSKQELLDQVWEGRVVADNVLSVSIAKLRKVLGHKPGEREYIENRYGRGYRFLQPLATVDEAAPRAPQTEGLLRIEGSPLVGRSASVRRLEAALARARAGNGSICVLVGEPGIGKTRLAEAFEHTARAWGALPAWGRCQVTEGTPPLWPFAQILRELSGSGVADEIFRVLRDGPHERPAGTVDAGASVDSPLYGTIGASHRTIDEVNQALYRLSKQQPLVILLDDLQWADAASLRLLSYLVGDISRWPIMVVATLRSTGLSGDHEPERDLRRLLSHRNCERIELGRLSESETEEYVSAMFGSGKSELSRAVFARSEGNPFFMVELLRPWLGLGNPAPQQLQLSGLALDLVRQRLMGMPDDARQVLSAAAVIGHDFDLGLLSHVTERSVDELLEALDGSLANDTVIPSPEFAGAYAFDHALIREVLYDDLPALERCRLHLRAGLGLERRSAAGAEIARAELAHHFLSALPCGDVSSAISHARRAAEAASFLCAHADARALLRRALDSLRYWIEPDARVRTALLLELSIVERTLADPAYVAHLEQGVALAREHGFGNLLTIAGQVLSPGPGLLAHADACNVLEAAADVLSESDEALRSIVLAHLSWTPPNSLSAKRVRTLLEEAEWRARRSGSLQAMAAVRDGQLFFSAGPATQAQAEAIADEIDRDLRAHPRLAAHQWRVVSTPTFRLLLSAQRGDTAAMDRAIAELAAIHDRLHHAELLWHHERMLLVMRMNRGEFSGVEAELERLRERAERLQLHLGAAICARDYGQLLLRTAQTSEFADRVRPSLILGRADSPTTRARKIRGLLDYGFIDDARAALANVSIESIYDLPCDRDYLGTLCHLAQASASARSLAHCQALYDLLLPYPDYYAVGISFHCDGSVSQFLGALARALARDEAALAHFEHALERNRRFGLLACTALSGFDLATLLLDSPSVRDTQRGRELLEQTQQAARRLGMYPLAQAAERRLHDPDSAAV